MRTTISILSFVTVIVLTPAAFGDTIVPGGEVAGIWSAAGSPYQVQGNIAVPVDSLLVIEPGVDVVFQENCALTVAGSLTAVGTAQDSIRFTAPERAEWSGIELGQTAGPVQLSHCIVERGAATGTGSDRDGGGINCYSGDVSIADCAFRQTRAVGWGGALCLHASGAAAALSDCVFSGNDADLDGGAVYYMGQDLDLTRCRFVGNTSERWGGGVYCFAYVTGIVGIDHCVFEGNVAADDGGGLMVENHAQNGITVSNCEFVSNDGGQTGGAIRTKMTNDVTIQNCVFRWNWGTDRGSAVYLDSGVSVVEGCTFDRNLAEGAGALYCDGTDAEIESCTFSSNRASGPGMALYLTNGTVSVANTVVSGTDDTYPYEGMCLGSGSFAVEYCDLFRRSDVGDFAGPGVPAGLGDIVGVNAVGDPCDAYSNILLDPFFCDRENDDLRIAEDSPCLGAGQGGVDIGAHGIGCETRVRSMTWGGVKALFR